MGVSIALEGSEGAGKSTLLILTGHILNESTKFPVMMKREPGGTDLGEWIRQTLKMEQFKEMHPLASTFLFGAQRAELFFKSETPFLEDNPRGILLKDRSWLSTATLQEAEGADPVFINEMVKPFISIPDKFALIDIPIDESILRINAAKHYSSDREIDWRDNVSKERLTRIRENYLNFAVKNRDRVFVLDCFDDHWESAKRVAVESLCMVARKEGFFNSSFEKSMAEFLDGDIKRLKAEDRFDLSENRARIEEMRTKLGFPSREILQKKMHEEWMSLGLEGFSSGIERGK